MGQPTNMLEFRGAILRRHDEISSTERLLDLIRMEGAAGVELPEPVSSSQTPETRKVRFPKLWRSKKTPRVSADSVGKEPDLEKEGRVAVEHPGPISSPQIPKRRKLHLAKILPLKKTITVGVDIREKELKLAKVKQPSDQRCELLDFKSVPLEPNISKDSPEFSEFLRVALSDFCGRSEKCELWAVMSSGFVEMKDIRIPSKVPKDQILNAVYWTIKKEVPFNEKESLLNFEILGDVFEQGISKTAVRVYTAPREEVAQLRDLFAKSGYALTGISVAPFAIQNLIRVQWIKADQKAVASLYVGTERSRIDIFNSENLVFTRGIKTGMNSLVEGILEGLKKAQEENKFSLTDDGAFHLTMHDEQVALNIENARKILFSLAPDFASSTEDEPGFFLKEEEVFSMILPALERLVRQIERSVEHYSLTLVNDVVSKLYLGGEINNFKKLVGYIKEQVGLPIDTIDPLAPGTTCLGGLTSPGSISERTSYVPALGMALSSNPHTPNFLFNYKDKENAARITRLNRTVFVSFICIVAICMGIFWWQGIVEEDKKSKIDGLRQKLAEYNPRTEQNLILLMAAKVKMKKNMLREYSKRYYGMTAIGELSQRTPSHIRLLDINANLGQVGKAVGKGTRKILTVEGLVFGNRQSLEASLAAYLMRLATSPVFRQPSIAKSSIESREGKEVLRFIAHLELV